MKDSRLAYNFRALIKQFDIPSKEWQIGKTKVFLRGCAHEPLEDARKTLTNKCALIVQRVWKGHQIRKGMLSVYKYI